MEIHVVSCNNIIYINSVQVFEAESDKPNTHVPVMRIKYNHNGKNALHDNFETV